MPEGFDTCRNNGGRIRTISGANKQFGVGKGQYKHICVLGGQVHQGELKTKKEK